MRMVKVGNINDNTVFKENDYYSIKIDSNFWPVPYWGNKGYEVVDIDSKILTDVKTKFPCILRVQRKEGCPIYIETIECHEINKELWVVWLTHGIIKKHILY